MSDTPNSFQAVKNIYELLKTHQGEIETFIRSLVETESPSGDEAGSRAVVDLLADAARMIESVSEIKRVDVPEFGQHLVIQAFAQQRSEGQILVVGHTDTVHARGSVAARPWRSEAGKIYGPGIFDMKANCGLILAVLRAMTELKIVPRRAITIALDVR